MAYTAGIRVDAGSASFARCRRFLMNDEGTTTVEWLAVAGVAIIIGVTMTWLATSNMGAATNFIEGKVNAAASQ